MENGVFLRGKDNPKQGHPCANLSGKNLRDLRFQLPELVFCKKGYTCF
jgi:hypothetical protein